MKANRWVISVGGNLHPYLTFEHCVGVVQDRVDRMCCISIRTDSVLSRRARADLMPVTWIWGVRENGIAEFLNQTAGTSFKVKGIAAATRPADPAPAERGTAESEAVSSEDGTDKVRESYGNHDRTGRSGLPANLDVEREGHGDDRARHQPGMGHVGLGNRPAFPPEIARTSCGKRDRRAA
jgi:hypothetical protein